MNKPLPGSTAFLAAREVDKAINASGALAESALHRSTAIKILDSCQPEDIDEIHFVALLYAKLANLAAAADDQQEAEQCRKSWRKWTSKSASELRRRLQRVSSLVSTAGKITSEYLMLARDTKDGIEVIRQLIEIWRELERQQMHPEAGFAKDQAWAILSGLVPTEPDDLLEVASLYYVVGHPEMTKQMFERALEAHLNHYGPESDQTQKFARAAKAVFGAQALELLHP